MSGTANGSGLFASVSIRNLTILLVALTLSLGLFLSLFTWKTFDLSKASDERWGEYFATSNEEVRAVSSVMGALGYGGLIHDFKNFLLRKDTLRSTETQRRIGALTETLDQLALIDVSNKEREAIALLRDTVASYGDKLQIAREMVAEGKTAEEIDAVVRYDDSPTVQAAEVLVNRVQWEAVQVSDRPFPPVQLVKLQSALGFGGVIHHFKNYILRGDDKSFNAFSGAAVTARAAIDTYRNLNITSEELRSLDVVSAMISAYERRLDQAFEMRQHGMSAEQIDEVVAYDDATALAAISTLERSLATRSADVAQVLSKHLLTTERISLLALAVAGSFSLFLSAAILAALRTAVVVPSQRIAEGLERLSEGDTDVDLSDMESDTEIGAIARAAGVFRDRSIELVRLREQMLHDSRAQTQSIVEAAADAILSTDGSGRIQSANPAAAALFEIERSELVGMMITELLDLPTPRTGESALEAFMHRKNESKLRGEVDARRSGNRVFPAKLALGKVQMHDGLVYSAIISDQTEAKKIERMKNEFVSTVSHELRTPLTSIKGSLGLLQASVLGNVSDQAHAMIKIAYNNCDRLVRLINDILDVEKIEAGKLNFEFGPVSISDQIDRVIEDTRSFASGLAVKVVAEGVAADLKIEADPDRMLQVLINLVSNAVKFSPKGSTVKLGAKQVGGGRLRVTVADRGPGITEEFRSRIFQKFAQNDTSDNRKSGGTGLGLSISKAIIEAHGGEIGFDSKEGKGTTFWFEVPLWSGIEAPNLDELTGLRPKILVIEDDADISQLLKIIIDEIGFDTQVCASTEEAKEQLRRGEFVAMTVDIGLPDRDGMSLIQDLRADQKLKDIPVIVISAASPDRDSELAGDAFKIFDWLKKPIDVDRLRNSLLRSVRPSGDGPLRILHIEDDPEHVAIVSRVVGDAGQCDFAASCKQARKKLKENDYDLVILDLLLPDGSGEGLISAINSNGTSPPQILVFSIREPDHELLRQVDGVLVKSRTSNSKLKAQLEKLLKNERKVREIETFN